MEEVARKVSKKARRRPESEFPSSLASLSESDSALGSRELRAEAPGTNAGEPQWLGEPTLRSRRNAWLAAAIGAAGLGSWGLAAWLVGLPIGGEVRSDPFGLNGPIWTAPIELVFKTIPHPAMANMPVVPAGSNGVLTLRSVPADFVNAPNRAMARIVEIALRANAAPPEPVAIPEALRNNAPLPDQKNLGAQSAQKFAPGPQRPSNDDFPVVSGGDPSKLAILFQAQGGKRLIAIAGTGGVYASDDRGETWSRPPPNAIGRELQFASTLHAFFYRFDDATQATREVVARLDVDPSDSNRVVPVFSANGKTAQRLEIRIDRGVEGPVFLKSAWKEATEAPNNSLAVELRGKTPLQFVGFAEQRDPELVDFATATFGGDSAEGGVWLGAERGILVYLRSPGNIDNRKLPTRATIRSIFFANERIGWASTGWNDPAGEERSGRPTIMQTTDGGAWVTVPYRFLPAPWVVLAFLFGLAALDRGARAHAALARMAEKPRIAEHGVSDDPVGLSDADALGLGAIAKAISRFLRNVETKPTVTIGVTGPWGSGKSSLMNMVREDFADRGVRSVWFNAWHYQKEDSLLAALLAAIRSQAVPPVWSPSGIRFRFAVAWRRIRDDALRSLIVIAIIVALILVVWWLGEGAVAFVSNFANDAGKLLDAKTVSEEADKLIKTLGVSSSVAGLIYTGFKLLLLFKPIKANPADLLASASDQSSSKDLQQQLAFRHRFAREFSQFCEVLRRPPHPGLVIFVDDLDRCGSRQTVDVLEALNFVSSAGKCFVIIGFDEAKVKAAIADVYKDTLLELKTGVAGKVEKAGLDELNAFAANYLEKLVHLIVPVPRSIEGAAEKLLGLAAGEVTPLRERQWRRRRHFITEAVTSIFMLALAFSVAVGIGALAYRFGSPLLQAQLSVVGSAGVNGAVQSPSGPPGANPPQPNLVQSRDLQRVDVDARSLSSFPPSLPVAIVALAVAILGLRYVPYFFAEPIVTDSNDFRATLRMWAKPLARRRTTPRALKRFVNRLRFLAMRLRDLEGKATKADEPLPLDEPLLITLAAIDEIDGERLGMALDHLKTAASGGAGDQRSGWILEGLEKLNRNPYADPDALRIYRSLAGIVVERAAGP